MGFLWNFQHCSEVFQVASRDGVRDIFFDQPWNDNASALGCARNAACGGVAPRQRWMTTCFGGRHLTESSNIVFSNGKLDPDLALAGDPTGARSRAMHVKHVRVLNKLASLARRD